VFLDLIELKNLCLLWKTSFIRILRKDVESSSRFSSKEGCDLLVMSVISITNGGAGRVLDGT
jgi:hypothetical protein